MNTVNRAILDDRIKEYLTIKLREILKDDFELIEDLVPDYIERYSLKELVIILRLEAEKRRRTPLR